MAEVNVKVVMIGESGAGKTSLATRFSQDRWAGDNQGATIGANFCAREFRVGGERLTMGLWDTAGSERFAAMTRSYFRGALAAVVVYDVTDMRSFERARWWTEELRRVEPGCASLVVVAAKTDLIPSIERAVPLADAEAFARSVGAEHIETSAKTGANCNAPFAAAMQAAAAAGIPAAGAGGGDGDNAVTILPATERKRGCCK